MNFTEDQIKKLAYAIYSRMTFEELHRCKQEMQAQMQVLDQIIDERAEVQCDG